MSNEFVDAFAFTCWPTDSCWLVVQLVDDGKETIWQELEIEGYTVIEQYGGADNQDLLATFETIGDKWCVTPTQPVTDENLLIRLTAVAGAARSWRASKN